MPRKDRFFRYKGKQPRRAATLAERVEFHSSPHPSGCRLWKGPLDKDGYGKFAFQRKHWRGHRAAWVSVHGSIPAGLVVCHACDTPGCVEISHLFLGTTDANNLDMLVKKRNVRGERVGISKLKAYQVLEIKSRPHERPAVLSAEYGVSPALIYAIRKGLCWGHLV